MPGPEYARLRAIAATRSMSVDHRSGRIVVTRTGPGTPRRLTARIQDDNVEAAARTLADELERTATPDTL